MSERDAINQILLGLNEVPLDSEDLVSDIAIAEKIQLRLLSTKKRILKQGWSFNEIERTLSPQESGFIPIPTSYLVLTPEDNTLTIRDWKMYDKDEQTYFFTEDVNVTAIEDVDFADLPYYMADYIVAETELKSYIDIVGSDSDIREKKEAVIIARADAIRIDNENVDNNLFTANDENSQLLDRGSL
jgi:hypothetical protein